jgi:hypothetical protein
MGIQNSRKRSNAVLPNVKVVLVGLEEVSASSFAEQLDLKEWVGAGGAGEEEEMIGYVLGHGEGEEAQEADDMQM